MPLSPERVSAIKERAEAAMWAEVVGCEDVQSKLDKCRAFIDKYSDCQFAAQHIHEAKKFIEEESQRVEAAAWNMLNKSDYTALVQYKNQYPNSIHMKDLEELAWRCTDQRGVQGMGRYVSDFPNSQYKKQAEDTISSIKEWETIKVTPDTSKLKEYIKANPLSPNKEEAEKLLWSNIKGRADLIEIGNIVRDYPKSTFANEASIYYNTLRDAELERMKANPSKYDYDKLGAFLKGGVFTKQELINLGIASEKSLEQILSGTKIKLPDLTGKDIIQEIKKDESYPGTDVFFLGIPSSGKTCTIMGLYGSSNIEYNHLIGGGKYSEYLEEYRNAGRLPSSTPPKFLTLIRSRVWDIKKNGEKVFHDVNIIEMAGERFASAIAHNENAHLGFNHLADDAVEYMKNNNQKLMFIFIDSSHDGTIMHNGVSVNQKNVIARLIDIMEASPEVMKKVTAIHILMTKADLLGDRDNRDSKALDRMERLYHIQIEHLKEIMKRYGINANNNYCPNLYTFSLGKFYVGNVFEYDPTDANKLVEAIKAYTNGKRQGGWNISDIFK